MTNRLCPNCYQMNSSSTCGASYCCWCGHNLKDEETIDRNEMSTDEWLDLVFTANKIQKIKAKQFIENFNKEEILANDSLLLRWWLTFCGVKTKQDRDDL